MTAVRDVEDCYRVTHVDAPEDAPASSEDTSSKDNSPLWRAVAQARREAEERLDREAGTSRGRIALIVGNERARAWGADVDGETALSERVSLLSAVASKGLEFDSVILVEPAEILSDGVGDLFVAEILSDGVGDLFVALTRATPDVHVVHCAPLPAGMEEW